MAVKNNPLFSVVVPVLNEEGNVRKLTKEIKEAMRELGSFELIYVDDGSTDGTGKKLREISSKWSKRGVRSLDFARDDDGVGVRSLDSQRSLEMTMEIVTFRKNFGQSAALDAGIKEAKGKYIVTLDGDGQNDPADIPKLFKKLQEGYDVVCGWRHKRKDDALKRFISTGARKLRSVLVDDRVHDAGCTLRVYRRECFEDLELTGEMHRMIPAILRWRGFRIAEMKVNHRARIWGKTKYTMTRTVKGFLDMLLIWFTRKYNNRPLHLFGSVGLFLITFSVILLGVLALMKIIYGYELSDKIWPLVGMMSFLAGLQLLVSGILADMIIKSDTKNKSWMIKETESK